MIDFLAATEMNGEVKDGGQGKRHIEAARKKYTDASSSPSSPITSIIAITLSLLRAVVTDVTGFVMF